MSKALDELDELRGLLDSLSDEDIAAGLASLNTPDRRAELDRRLAPYRTPVTVATMQRLAGPVRPVLFTAGCIMAGAIVWGNWNTDHPLVQPGIGGGVQLRMVWPLLCGFAVPLVVLLALRVRAIAHRECDRQSLRYTSNGEDNRPAMHLSQGHDIRTREAARRATHKGQR